MSAEQTVRIDGSGSSAIPISNTPSTPIYTIGVSPLTIRGTYTMSLSGLAGVNGAANNYLSLFNPTGSGVTIYFGGTFISSTAAAAATNTEPMNAFRITAASAGTLVTNSTTVAKFQTSAPTSTMELRTGNPTVTLGPQVLSSPPVAGSNAATTPVHIATVPIGAAFTLVEGEGIVLRTANGDVDTRWNIGMTWSEV